MKRLILASESPRRKKLLKELGLEFEVIPSKINENIDLSGLDEYDTAKFLAKMKAENVAKKLKEGFVIGADTIVVLDKKILGKPKDYIDAYNMLSNLSGRKHQVITGIVVIDVESQENIISYERTNVEFSEIDEKTIVNYINTKEPYDKAGSYAIQGIGKLFVKGIEGCYFNVVGLPLYRLSTMLKQFKINII